MNLRPLSAASSPSPGKGRHLKVQVAMIAWAFSAVTIFVSSVSAQPPSLDPLQPAFPVRPATGGWYQAASNFGNLNLDISDSGIVAGTWSTYDDNGLAWYYFQSTLETPTIEETQADGIISRTEFPLYKVVSGSPCLTCAYAPPVVAPSGDNVRIEFTSSRLGRFVLNDMTTIPITAWMQGAPLFIERDYSGDWLAVGRREHVDTQGNQHHEAIAQVRLERIAGPEEYFTEILLEDTHPATETAPPEAGARRYRLTCIAPQETCGIIRTWMVPVEPYACTQCGPGELFAMLWINPGEAGGFALSKDRAQFGDPAQQGYNLYRRLGDARIHGERDRLLMHSKTGTSSGTDLLEMVLQRMPAGMFDSDKLWQHGRLDDSSQVVP